MITRQELRDRAPVFTGSRPQLHPLPTLFQTLKANAFYIPQLATAAALGFLLHSFI